MRTTGAFIEPDLWLGRQLHREAFHLRFEGGEGPAEDIARLLDPYLRRPSIFIDTQLDASRIMLSQACESAGFRLADTRVQLCLHQAPRAGGSASGHIRAARPEDRDAVAALAARSLRGSRFHQDSLIPPACADALKAAWASNFFSGGRGDGMAVAEVAEQVAGFLLYLCRHDTLIIDLVAVDADLQGRGLGSGLVAFASQMTGVTRLAVGTQASNTTSLRFYQGLGFRVERICHVFHHHGLSPLKTSRGAA